MIEYDLPTSRACDIEFLYLCDHPDSIEYSKSYCLRAVLLEIDAKVIIYQVNQYRAVARFGAGQPELHNSCKLHKAFTNTY